MTVSGGSKCLPLPPIRLPHSPMIPRAIRSGFRQKQQGGGFVARPVGVAGRESSITATDDGTACAVLSSHAVLSTCAVLSTAITAGARTANDGLQQEVTAIYNRREAQAWTDCERGGAGTGGVYTASGSPAAAGLYADV